VVGLSARKWAAENHHLYLTCFKKMCEAKVTQDQKVTQAAGWIPVLFRESFVFRAKVWEADF